MSKLQNYGFRQSPNRKCLFILDNQHYFLALLVYVDDVLITSTSENDISKFKTFYINCLLYKNIDYCKYFFGIEIARSLEGTYVNQPKYALNIINGTGLSGCHIGSNTLTKGN